jgi:hypothetical protein
LISFGSGNTTSTSSNICLLQLVQHWAEGVVLLDLLWLQQHHQH